MPWVRVDDAFDDHPKFAEVGPLGIALWLAGLAFCNRNLTNGFIPWRTARSLVSWEYLGPPDAEGRRRAFRVGVTSGMSGQDVDCPMVIDLLLAADLWEEVDGGYQIHDYLEYQPSKEQVEREREKTAERVSRWRDARRNGVTNGSVTDAPKPNTQTHVVTPTEHLPKEETAVAIHALPLSAAERASKPPKDLEPRYSEDFEVFWAAYPRKREKVDAYAAWQKTLKAGAAADDLIAAATHYAAAADEQGAEDRFIKLPATFLGPARPWLDFRHGVPAAAARVSPAANGRHKPNAFDQIDLAVARMKGGL